MRRATAVWSAFVIVLAGAAARAEPQAQALGKAWKALRDGNFEAARAAAKLDKLKNRDYAQYLAAQAMALGGDPEAALPIFSQLAKTSDSRFQEIAAWRAADCLWDLGRTRQARAAYERLVPSTREARIQNGDITSGPLDGDPGVGLARIAQSYELDKNPGAALPVWRRLALERPAHPLAADAAFALARGSAPLTPREHIVRAERLTADRSWDAALEELALVSDENPEDVRNLRDFWIGTTLFKMRRQYERAGRLLIAVHDKMGPRAPEALFHGARALSRADLDDEAIQVYGQVVAKYPSSDYAAEAQFLSGWLEFNRGRWREALPGLNALLAKYPSSRFAADARWYVGFSHFLLGEHELAIRELDKIVAKGGGALVAGKARYWRARAFAALGKADEATTELRRIVGAYPLSWYALLARARLQEAGEKIDLFGDRDGPAPRIPTLGKIEPQLVADPLIARVDELLAAGLTVEAGLELRRGEAGFTRKYTAARALPVLIARYEKAGNYNRPWMLAESYGGRALSMPPTGDARAWWERAYPRAFRPLVERHEALGKNPPLYLYAIMRKESGFDPHVVSYADAIGLLQMIPPTTQRVVKKLEMDYSDDLLYDSELNVKVGSWYIGGLVQKFKGQIPIAAGSFNCGPRPVMRWLEQNGARPVDEFVELVAYTQTREYMKKVTDFYAHYLLLYEGKPYRQPLVVDAAYQKNDLDY